MSGVLDRPLFQYFKQSKHLDYRHKLNDKRFLFSNFNSAATISLIYICYMCVMLCNSIFLHHLKVDW